jgi:hypothetical protein
VTNKIVWIVEASPFKAVRKHRLGAAIVLESNDPSGAMLAKKQAAFGIECETI